MAEEEAKKIEGETPVVEAPKDVCEEKPLIPPPQKDDDKADDSKALAVVVAKVPEPVKDEGYEGSIGRDKVLERVTTEKRLSLIKAWEENEKSIAENKAHKKASAVGSWENTKKASVEADLKRQEENLEKKKAALAEKLKNKIALVHKLAEEKRAIIEAKRGEDLLKVEETAAKYRATGTAPKKFLGWF